MNSTSALTLAIWCIAVNTQAADIRKVGQASVNLDPVHEWMRKRTGERPMPHWRVIKPEAFLGVINGANAFRMVVEGTETKEILLQNPPPTMLRLGKQMRDLETKLGRVEAVASAAKRASVIARANRDTTPYPYYSRYSTTGYRRQRAAQARAEAEVVRARAAVELTAIERANLEKQLSTVRTQLVKTQELAMFSGRTIDGRELWDCGVKTP
jgi:hypothetical protein